MSSLDGSTSETCINDQFMLCVCRVLNRYCVIGVGKNLQSRVCFPSAIIYPSIDSAFYFLCRQHPRQRGRQGLFVGTKGQIGSFDLNKFLANKPDLVLTNGMAFKYFPSIGTVTKIEINKNATFFKVKPGELARWYIINAGPRGYVSFNFAGGMINLNSGSVNNSTPTNSTEYGTQLKTYETTGVPPGDGVVIETVFPEQGVYVGNDHDIGRFMMGAGFVVIATNNSTNTDFPSDTWVPPKDSNFVSGSQYAMAIK